MEAAGFLKRSRNPALVAVGTERDLTAEAQGILPSGTGGSVAAARSSFIRGHCCWNARGLEDIIDARLHHLRNQGSATERKKALLIGKEVTNRNNTTVGLTSSNWTGSKTGKWVLMVYPISTTVSRLTTKNMIRFRAYYCQTLAH